MMIYNLIIGFILYFICYYNISFLLSKIKKRYWVLLGSLLFIISIFIARPFRMGYQVIILTLLFCIAGNSFKTAICAVIFQFFLLLIIDCLYCVLLYMNPISFYDYVGVIGVIISFLSCFMIRTTFFTQLWNMIQQQMRYVFIFLFLLLVLIYIHLGYQFNMINEFILILLILIFIYILLKLFVQTYYIKNKTEIMFERIESYEQIFHEFRIQQHDYINILLLLKGMVSNVEAQSYIDMLLTHDHKDYQLIQELSKIPIESIRGVLYYQLLLCKQKEIHAVLNVSSDIPFKSLLKIDLKNQKDLIMVLGELLDYAIHSCLKTEQKSLSIYCYEENKSLVFQISNTFYGILNIEVLYKRFTMDKNEYSGISFAKRIVRSNKKLHMKAKVHGDVLIQYVKLEF